MAIVTDTYRTLSATNIPEQVLDGIYMIEREESPIYSSAKKKKIYTQTPEFQTQALASPATNAMAEGEAFVVNAAIPTVRAKNHCQILDKVCSVTASNQAVKHYGYSDQMSYEKELKTKELKRDIEFAIVQNNASVANANGVAGEMGGIESWIATNVSRGAGGANGGYSTGTGLTTAATDGAQRPFTEALLLDVLQSGYDNGAKFSVIHLGSHNKTKLSSFQGGANRQYTGEKKVTNTVDIYESDFGTLTAAINPRQRTRTALLYDMSKIAVLQLRAMQTGKLAKTNDSDEEFIVTEMTTEVIEKGLGAIADLTTA